MKGIYLTQEAKQEIEAKIAELEKADLFYQKNASNRNPNYALNSTQLKIYKEILQSATILPVENLLSYETNKDASNKSRISFEKFKNDWFFKVLPNKHPECRDGQSLMNYLADIWFEEYQRISSLNYYDETNIDCFYNDKLINNTLSHLEKIWK